MIICSRLVNHKGHRLGFRSPNYVKYFPKIPPLPKFMIYDSKHISKMYSSSCAYTHHDVTTLKVDGMI